MQEGNQGGQLPNPFYHLSSVVTLGLAHDASGTELTEQQSAALVQRAGFDLYVPSVDSLSSIHLAAVHGPKGVAIQLTRPGDVWGKTHDPEWNVVCREWKPVFFVNANGWFTVVNPF
jgi:hypothetical protein